MARAPTASELLPHHHIRPDYPCGRFKSIDGEQAGALAQIHTKQARQLIYPALAVGLIVLGIAKKVVACRRIGGRLGIACF